LSARAPFELEFAGSFDVDEVLRGLRSPAPGSDKKLDPPDFFEKGIPQGTFLTKFSARLTPAQMKDDLVFSPAPDQEPFRKTIYR
ncbi:MAG: hypothetical protein RDV41_03080, partial [Planctomycetota bacterium]|nr:hypothetical protein [Planctomycetota bacterium]